MALNVRLGTRNEGCECSLCDIYIYIQIYIYTVYKLNVYIKQSSFYVLLQANAATWLNILLL
jgi:hypothetical protein